MTQVEVPHAPDGQARTRTATVVAGGLVTVGVEEEFLLVDELSRSVVPRAAAVLAGAAHLGTTVQQEMTLFQVETTSSVCSTMGALHDELTALRRTVDGMARRNGMRINATGTAVLGHPPTPPITDAPRYRRIAERFGSLIDGQSICGCHVHLGVSDAESALRVMNHLRPWLPTLLAMSANSPFWHGRDTRHASWRYLIFGRWPTAGPPPHFDSVDDYDAAVRTLLRSGAALDRGMIYWDVRRSCRHPTVELRVCDVAATVDDAVLIAALTRALGAQALLGGRPRRVVSQCELRAALWRAAHDGLEGRGVDVFNGRTVRAFSLVERLVQQVRGELADSGDLDMVLDLVARLRSSRSGAYRQRVAFAERGNLVDVVDLLSAQTVA
ncbi:glutamate--cysteine ligase [Allokutzneria multivorans]|uniref:Putative glutamate--cysteine ligase 2 n=1 Tax=Allokutzneria multivorans TaxID=1142134 RepID=A0ABP7U313_9PSEU